MALKKKDAPSGGDKSRPANKKARYGASVSKNVPPQAWGEVQLVDTTGNTTPRDDGSEQNRLKEAILSEDAAVPRQVQGEMKQGKRCLRSLRKERCEN
jgi:hypothetical protein